MPELPSKTKVFVPPEIYPIVRKAIADVEKDLKPRHVIVCEELEGAVMAATRPGQESTCIRGKDKIRRTDRKPVALRLQLQSIMQSQQL